jgi:hypothetical protein
MVAAPAVADLRRTNCARAGERKASKREDRGYRWAPDASLSR